jgi:hypothetical protein
LSGQSTIPRDPKITQKRKEHMENMAPRIETAEDLERIVAEQTAAIQGLHVLVKAMDAKLRLQQALIDNMQQVLIDNGLAKPRPKEEAIVN